VRLVVKMPTRSRPQKFFQVIDRYINFCSGVRDVHFFVSMDHSDFSMNNQNVHSSLQKLQQKTNGKFHYEFGDSKTKIEACNANLDKILQLNPDIILLASDDMIPIISGYDDIICKDMENNFPDTDGVLHYNDGFSGKDNLITLSILGRKYFDRFGYIYNPEYKSVFSDDEFTQIARILNKVVYSDRCIIQHQWVGIPYILASRGEISANEVQRDSLHERNESQQFYDYDRAIYEKNKANNFGLVTELQKEKLDVVATNS
jgi:hypothetical protein